MLRSFLRSLVLVAATMVVFVAPAPDGSAPDSAQALALPFDCHGKIGVARNNTSDPINYPYNANLSATFMGLAGGAFDLNISAPGPIIPVSATVSAADVITGSSTGVSYNGLPSSTSVSGTVRWYDLARTQPSWISFVQQIRSSQGNPFPNIDYNFECPIEPPAAVADEDNDFFPGVAHFTLPSVTSIVQAQLSPSMTNLIVRHLNQTTSPVALSNPANFKMTMTKDELLEGIAERERAETAVTFGGALNPANSAVAVELPSELGGGNRFSDLSGWQRGEFDLYHGGLQGGLMIESGVAGFPFAFDPDAQSGAWYTTALPIDPLDFTINLDTGELTGSGQFNAYFDNLADAGSTQASSANSLGGPLLFDYTVTAEFPSLAALSLLDNCPDVDNPDQLDANDNGIGDICDGFVWADSDCSTIVDPLDALETAAAAASIDTGASDACAGGTSSPTPDSYEWGDWNCDESKNAADMIVPLKDAADVAQSDLPVNCPAPGTFIPALTP